jgi:hypothetical protein
MFAFQWVEQSVSEISISYQAIMWLNVIWKSLVSHIQLKWGSQADPRDSQLEAPEPRIEGGVDVD